MQKEKILFVEPTGAPSNVFANFMTIPLLGPVYLSEIACQKGHDARILSENILKRPVRPAELAWADVLCLSCITATVTRGREIARLYRETRAQQRLNGRTLIGGIHASMLPDDVRGDFDQVVVGEAEDIFMDIIEGRLRDPVVRGDRLEDLDRLPLLDFRSIAGWDRMRVWPVMTSRGCPHHCNFCSVTEMFGRGFRAQSPARIIRQLEHFRRGWVFFADDNFTADQARAEELMERMIQGRFGLPWSAQVRTEITKKPRLVHRMKQAGCRTVYVGFESVSGESLRLMRKGQSPEDLERTVRVFHQYGIAVLGMFILGHDTDSADVMRQTMEFCRKSRVDFVQYTILTPLPGTSLYRRLEGERRLLHRDWKYYDAMHAVFTPKQLSASELQKFMIRCFGDFYSYRRAALELLRLVVRWLLRIFAVHRYGPSLHLIAVRIAGRHILWSWLRKNRLYLRYLEQFERSSLSRQESSSSSVRKAA